MGAKESGQAFIAGVLAKLPEADRAAAQALFAKPEAEAAITLIGDGTLARSDYSKQMDELRKQTDELAERKETLDDWWGQNEAALKEYLVIKPEYDKLKGNPNPNPNPNNPNPPVGGLTKDELQQEIERRDRAFAGAMGLGMDLSAKHMHMFQEPLNMTELLADPNIGREIKGQPGRFYGLQEAYDTKHGVRVQEKVTAAHNATIEKEVQKRLDEERRKLPQQMPYPLRDPSPSPLDALNATDRKPADFSVDSATAEYERLQQARSQAGA